MIILNFLNLRALLLAELFERVFVVTVKFLNFLIVGFLELRDHVFMLASKNISRGFHGWVVNTSQGPIHGVLLIVGAAT
jgi:hypothetical protein